MSINIQFTDFDTVCYSVQHNLMKLIEKAVGLSIEVNINAANISQVQQNVEDMKPLVQEGHDAWLLASNLNEHVSSNTYWIDQILDNSRTFKSSQLGRWLRDLEERVSALE